MYLQFDEDFPNHPKAVRLCTALQHPVGWAYITKLWCWAKKFQQDGNLTAYDPGEIEFAVGWTLADGKFYAAAVRAGFIDEERDGDVVVARRLHNWMKRSGADITKMEDQAARKKRWRDHQAKPRRCIPDECEFCASEAASDDVVSPALDVHGTSTGQTDQDQSSPVQTKQDQTSPVQDQKGDGGETAKPSAPSQPPPAEILLTYPCDGIPREWYLTKSQVARWRELFPSLDLGAECRAALAYVEAAPTRRKTATGMPKYLTNWLTKSQNEPSRRAAADRARGSPQKGTGYSPVQGDKDWKQGAELFTKG
jgi:hypothetical protein